MDVESDYYYLQTRYYSPVLRRFLSHDRYDLLSTIADDGHLNLYIYCNNNPVMYTDPTGEFPIAIIIGVIIGSIIGFGGAVITDYTDDGQIFNGSVEWYDYLGATVLSGAIGAGIGYALPYISSFASTSFALGGGGLAVSGGGSAAITAGFTITGAEVLLGMGVLTGVTVLPAIIGKSGGYTVKKFPNDHDPAHVHIFGDDIADKAHGIRVGLDGKPLLGQGKLPHGARKALKKLWEQIFKALTK